MKAKSIRGNSPEEIKTVLKQSMFNGYKPTLAVVFISIKQDQEPVCELLDQKGIQNFGATTSFKYQYKLKYTKLWRK